MAVALSIYKKGQGTAARGTAAVVVMLLAGWAAHQMWFTAEGWPIAAQVIATGLVAGLLGLLPLYLVLFYQPVAEMLIETQQEMRKVAWSSRAEVIGSTVVVVVTVVLLSLFIFATDWVLLSLARIFGIY